MRPVEALLIGLLVALAISTSGNYTLALTNRTEAFSKVGDMDMEEFVLLKRDYDDYGNVTGSYANKAKIKPMGSFRKIGGPLGNVTSCASRGKLLEVRVKDCPHMPCNITAGMVLPFQIDFKPAASHDKLRVRFSVISVESKSGAVILDEEVLEPIVAGRPYTLQVASLQVTSGTRHGDVVPLLEITDELVGGKIMELCAFGLNRNIY